MKPFFLLIFLAFQDYAYASQKTNEIYDSLTSSSPSIKYHKVNSSMDHLNYMYGAFSGALLGSFFVHIFDSLGAYQFVNTKKSLYCFTKTTLKSYLPVAIGVVPARAFSFGVFSFSQSQIGDHLIAGPVNVAVSAALCGLSLALLSTPAELLKTRKQLDQKSNLMNMLEIKKSFPPLAVRIIPTVSIMLTGSTLIQDLLPINNIGVSTTVSTIIAACISHIIATPAENIRIYRIQNNNYTISNMELLKNLFLQKKIYAGYFPRSLSLGIQAAFTLTAANLIRLQEYNYASN